MKTKVFVLIVLILTSLNAWSIKGFLGNIDDGVHRIVKHNGIKTMNEAEYTNKTLSKDTKFAKVSFIRTAGRNFIVLLKPKTKNILIKIQTQKDNQVVSTLLDVNFSKPYKIECYYQGNLKYNCRTTDSIDNLIDFKSFKLKNGKNYLTIQNPFSDKVKTIGCFEVDNDKLYFEKK
jgi:hypothetical protein